MVVTDLVTLVSSDAHKMVIQLTNVMGTCTAFLIPMDAHVMLESKDLTAIQVSLC